MDYISESFIDAILEVNNPYNCDNVESILFEGFDISLVEFIRNTPEREASFNRWTAQQEAKKKAKQQAASQKESIFSRAKKVTNNLEKGINNFADVGEKAKQHQETVAKDYQKAKKIGKSAAIGAGIIGAATIIKYAYEKYKKHKYGQCGDLKGQDRTHCQIKAIDVAISELRSRSSLCSKSDNPESCKQQIQDKIQKLSHERQSLLKSL